MWHLSFAAANLVLSVATAVAFSSKLSRGWIKLKRIRAGAAADKEVWGQVPLWNPRKPLISSSSWQIGVFFEWGEDSIWGDACLPHGWVHPGCAQQRPVLHSSLFLSGFLYFPLHFVYCVQQAYSVLAFLVAERGHLSRRRGNLVSGSAADWIQSVSMCSSKPKLIHFTSGVMQNTALL